MSERKHTPGEWTVDSGEAIRVRAPDGSSVCQIHMLTKTGRRHGDESMANAHLMAAAPDLLDALENLGIAVGMGWDTDGVMEKAIAAIAKATGADQ